MLFFFHVNTLKIAVYPRRAAHPSVDANPHGTWSEPRFPQVDSWEGGPTRPSCSTET